jgi:nucleoside-diphosphate-sugar epimerase
MALSVMAMLASMTLSATPSTRTFRMRIFITGATGHIGSAVVSELLGAGHEVVGLARRGAAADTLTAAGVRPHRGDLTDLGGLRAAAAESDGVIHLAFRHDLLKTGGMVDAAATDREVVEAIGAELAGSDRPLVTTSATMLLSFSEIAHRPFSERDALPGGPRIDTENATVALADQGVRASVVRLPPVCHSPADGPIGFVPTLVRAAREAGASGILDGAVRWPAVHTRDAARLYRLAVESAPAGSRLHAVAEEAIPFRAIAEAIGRGLDLPLDEIDADEAARRFGFVARFTDRDAPTSSALTRELLGWTPSEIGLIDDLDAGHYFRQ